MRLAMYLVDPTSAFGILTVLCVFLPSLTLVPLCAGSQCRSLMAEIRGFQAARCSLVAGPASSIAKSRQAGPVLHSLDTVCIFVHGIRDRMKEAFR
jgi:hypothetical protein